MKTKRFNVFYNVTTHYEADVLASTKKEAIEKVIEVLGGAVRIESVYEMPVEVLTNEEKA